MTRRWKWVERRRSSDSADGFVEMIWESCWGSIVWRSHAPQVMKAYVEGSSHRSWFFKKALKRSQTCRKGSAWPTVSWLSLCGTRINIITARLGAETHLSYPSQLVTKLGQMRSNDRFHVFVKHPHFLLLLKVIHDCGELDDLHLMLREIALSTCRLKVQDQEVSQFASHSASSSRVKLRGGRR